jgi:hypothetical protein
MLMKSPEKLVHTMSIKKFGQGGEYPTCLDKKKFILVVFFCFQIRHLFDKFFGQKFGNLENKFIYQQVFLLPATTRILPPVSPVSRYTRGYALSHSGKPPVLIIHLD